MLTISKHATEWNVEAHETDYEFAYLLIKNKSQSGMARYLPCIRILECLHDTDIDVLAEKYRTCVYG